MPKAPRDNESTTPKKRTRKAAAPKNGNGVHADAGNGAVEAVTVVATEAAPVAQATTTLEEQIRFRAYELYLQRGGHGGSPEQDWLRAKEEICGQRAS